MNHRALFLEGDDWTARIVKSALKLQGFQVISCRTEREFLNHLATELPHVLVIDLHDEPWRLNCAKDLRKRGHGGIPKIVVGRDGVVQKVAEAERLQKEEWLLYPVRFNRITMRLEEIKAALEKSPLYSEKAAGSEGVDIGIAVAAKVTSITEAGITVEAPVEECRDDGKTSLSSPAFQEIGAKNPRVAVLTPKSANGALSLKPADWSEPDLTAVRKWTAKNRIGGSN